ncbi:MAG TPA: hypothetical protein EYN67_00165 [Flavobacteriales bacterium]|nr:hypothetical protein [Flavobacteriales bacterium]
MRLLLLSFSILLFSITYSQSTGYSYTEACNYDDAATDDDGSCWYAEMYYDCGGNGINDADGDDVCDELEISGCTDPKSCNTEFATNRTLN